MRFLRYIGATLALVVASGAAQAAGDAKAGAQVFQRCAICHNAAKGAGAKIGPNLWGVVGRKAGTEPGFSYSSAMQKAGFVWTDAKLDAYLKAPQSVVPGNKMPFAGLSSATDRANVTAYLDTLK